MFMTCRHIKTNGLRCESPALKGAPFCYYHSKIHSVGAEPHLNFGPLQLPAPEDAAAIQLSVARINDAIISGRLDLKKAASLFNGLRIAASFLDRKRFFHQAGTVQFAEQGADGADLAPVELVCDDVEACKDCLYTDLCPRGIHPSENDRDGDGKENK